MIGLFSLAYNCSRKSCNFLRYFSHYSSPFTSHTHTLFSSSFYLLFFTSSLNIPFKSKMFVNKLYLNSGKRNVDAVLVSSSFSCIKRKQSLSRFTQCQIIIVQLSNFQVQTTLKTIFSIPSGVCENVYNNIGIFIIFSCLPSEYNGEMLQIIHHLRLHC